MASIHLRRLLCGVALAGLSAGLAQAQTGEASSVDEVVVTATKRAGGQVVQDVPSAITAFGTEQLDAKQVRNLEALSFSVPNVQLNAVGTVPATANFSIRGLGINSSIQSIEPTVGVFVDGIYLGVNVGVLFDTFDLAGVEVLRGPQGLLFGKNVTGGAVLVRSSDPTTTFHFDGRASVESGPNYTTSAVVSGPIGGGVSAKIAAYYNKDTGWFTNKADNDHDYGGGETKVIRAALRYDFGGGGRSVLRLEHGESDQNSEPPSQNRARYRKNTFDVEGNGLGFGHAKWDQAIWQVDLPVGFGDGVVTNIMGYRDLNLVAQNDVDSIREFYLTGQSLTEQDQFSNELRYSGKLGPADVTAGVFYFEQDLFGISGSLFGNGAGVQTLYNIGGGHQKTKTGAVFAAADWHLSDTLTLNLGARYSEESKRVQISSVRAGGCVIAAKTCAYNFRDRRKTDFFTPKVGLQWQPDGDTQLYAFYTRGYRSGGYNFRSPGATGDVPGPTGDEKQDSFEAGLKVDLADRRARINAAVYRNKIYDLQREVNFIDPVLGNLQIYRNTANATIQGVEVETLFRVTSAFTINGQLGVTDGQYTKVFYDLNRDGVINNTDLNLKLPRLAPLSWGVGANYVMDLGDRGALTARIDFNHRDSAAYTDANTTFFSPADMLDASLAWKAANGVTVSVYGRNLLNEVTEGIISPLPATWGGPGATQAPLNKGRVVGLAARYTY